MKLLSLILLQISIIGLMLLLNNEPGDWAGLVAVVIGYYTLSATVVVGLIIYFYRLIVKPPEEQTIEKEM
jgi:hypothetical protein